MFKKKAAVAAAKEAAEKAAAEKAASVAGSNSMKVLQDGSNGKCKRMQNTDDHRLQDSSVQHMNNKAARSNRSDRARLPLHNTIDRDDAYDNFDMDEPILSDGKKNIKGSGPNRRKSKKKSIEELLGSSSKEITTLDNKFDSLLQSASPKQNPKKSLKNIRSKYDNFDDAYDTFGEDADSDHDLFSITAHNRTKNFKVPRDYLKYNDDEVREMGILVQVRQYKKDKYLPLTDGNEVRVDKGTFVTFYKNAQQIHMKINDKMYIPDVEQDHIAGIFKDYTEKEIADSDRIRNSIEKGGDRPIIGMGVLEESAPAATTRNKASVGDTTLPGKTKGSKGGGKKVAQKKKEAAAEKPTPAKGRKAAAGKKKAEEKTEELSATPPPNKKAKKNSISSSANNIASMPPSSPKKVAVKKMAKTPNSVKKIAAKKSKKQDIDTSSEHNSESPTPPKPKATARKRVSNSGGECPLCSRTFSRTRDLMEHCSTCEGSGSGGAGTSGTGAARGRGGSKTPKPVTPKVNLSDCPICSKKVASKDLERHARLCAENMFG